MSHLATLEKDSLVTMPLPVAHGLLGASIAAALQPSESPRWRTLCVCALLGVCPDFDYALNWLRVSGGGWHHGFTHSILFALFIGSLTDQEVGNEEWERCRLTIDQSIRVTENI